MIAAVRTALGDFLHAPCSGYRIAAVRILFALYLLVYFGAMAPHVPQMFSHEGVYVPYLVPDYAPPPAVAWLPFAVMYAATIALLVGHRTALAAPLLLALFLYHYFLQLAVKQSAFDRLIAVILLVLCLSDSGRALGRDARRPGPTPTRWGERVLAAQLVLLYFGAGLWKLFNPAWHEGTLLRSTFQGMFATPLAFALVQQDWPPAAWTLLSRSVIAFELLLGVLLVVPRARPLALLLGLGFHLANCVLLVIPEFLVCVTAYPVFVREAALRDWAGRAHGAVRRFR